jgi:VWFA-related protein
LIQARPYNFKFAEGFVMPFIRSLFSFALFLSLVVFLAGMAGAQQPSPTPVEKEDDVLRVNTDLMQTELMVFDKEGHFVGGLRPDQLELKVNNKPQQVSFLEQVRAGSASEAEQRKQGPRETASSAETSTPLERGRTIIFFVDDLHLSRNSFERARQMLEHFVDTEMSEKDQVIFLCSSGQLGDSQRFTSDKALLKAAVAKLAFNLDAARGNGRDMSEYAAQSIDNGGDPRALRHQVAQCEEETALYRSDACNAEAKGKAQISLQRATSVTLNTYGALEALLNSASHIPGRKLAFFISDGFLVDTGYNRTEMAAALKRVLGKATANGVVVYTIDARGLVAASGNKPEGLATREIAASDEALDVVAKETGGRLMRNQNFAGAWVAKVLDETANYYLLAWYLDEKKPAGDPPVNLKMQVIGHPEYSVRFSRGALKGAQPDVAENTVVVRTPQEELKEALLSQTPRAEVPLSLSAFYLDTPDGLVLRAAVQVKKDALGFETKAKSGLPMLILPG